MHLIVTDPDARLPEFLECLNALVARALNAHYGRFEIFWSGEKCGALRLENPEDVLDKMVYTLTNPVEAGLVAFGVDWPGLRNRPEEVDEKEYVATRPDFFFRESMPEKMTLRLSTPPAFKENPNEFRKTLSERVNAAERAIRKRFSLEKGKFLGAHGVLSQSPFAAPSTAAPRFELNPQIACRNKWLRIEILRHLKSFRKAYRKARKRFRAGDRDVIFPRGTYWMRVHLGVRTLAPT